MQNGTVLTDRVLWYDGTFSVIPANVRKYPKLLDSVFVTEVTSEIDAFNKLMPKNKQISTKKSLNRIVRDWNIPEQYRSLDICSYVRDIHERFLLEGNDEPEQRRKRLDVELKLFEKHDLFPLIRALIFIINTFKQHNQVWGTGRGSSVSSYAFFLLEIHDVDSFAYQLDITDFIK